MKKLLRTALVTATLLAAPAAAQAAPSLAPVKLEAPEQAKLAKAVEAARKASPKAFEALSSIEQSLTALDQKKRGRKLAVAPLLKPLGEAALLPMLERLAISGPDAQLAPALRATYRAGVVEAVGALRDERARAVLISLLDSDDEELLKATVGALSRLGDDVSVGKVLGALSSAKGARRAAVVAALGECRRAACAKALGAELDGASEPDDIRSIARALGRQGSSWAWKTPVIAASGDEASVRGEAARALVAAFARASGPARDDVQTALMVVDAPSTPQLIADARKSAPASTQAALDELAARLSNNAAR